MVQLNGRALADVELVAPTAPVLDGGQFRWDVVDQPEGSTLEIATTSNVARVFLQRRGTYLIERWHLFGVGEDLTHRFLIQAAGSPPVAIPTTPSPAVTVNGSVTVDGSTSMSPEGLPLTYHWRLVTIPQGSVAMLTTTDEPQTSFTPDIAGGYSIELTVSDGELTNEMPARLTVNAQ